MLTDKLLLRKEFIFFLLVVFLFLIFSTTADAKTIFVDLNNTSGVEDGTEDHPFNTIQEGINVSLPEDTVKVAPGVYNENISINAVNIKLIGDDPETTVVKGTSNVVNITGTFNPGYELVEIAGFTITGGSNNGIYLNSNTVIGEIHNNNIFGNGNGIYGYLSCDAFIYNNVITQNTGSGITNRNNSAASVEFTISNNIISENGVYGIYKLNYGTYLALFNNVWGNISGNYQGTISQQGGTSVDPLFIDVDTGNYRLASSSPCIDAGQPIAADNDPDGTRNDQGVYGGPGAANFWPDPAGGPVVTTLSVTPPSVVSGGTISITATGKIR